MVLLLSSIKISKLKRIPHVRQFEIANYLASWYADKANSEEYFGKSNS